MYCKHERETKKKKNNTAAKLCVSARRRRRRNVCKVPSEALGPFYYTGEFFVLAEAVRKKNQDEILQARVDSTSVLSCSLAESIGCRPLTDDDVFEDVGVVVRCGGHRGSERQREEEEEEETSEL